MAPTTPLNDIDLHQEPQLPGAFPATNGSSTPTKPLPVLSGTTPGVVDLTQPSRLLRTPGATLSFASFNPHAASSTHHVPDLNNLNLNDQSYRPKRVVVETLESGEQFWRFVPSAKKEHGVESEGQWPRVIEICGQLYECTQDQWDIYKLDPLYDCLVRSYPNLTVISMRTPPSTPGPSSRASPMTIPGTQKRARVYSRSPSPMGGDVSPLPTRSAKRVHIDTLPIPIPDSDSDADSESEVEEMIIDDLPPPRTPRTMDKDKRRKRTEARHKGEKVKLVKKADKFASEETENRDPNYVQTPILDDKSNVQPPVLDTKFNTQSPVFGSSSPPIPADDLGGKRRVDSLFESLRTNSQDGSNPVSPTSPGLDEDRDVDRPEYLQQNGKRTRKMPVLAAKHELNTKRTVRERKKLQRRQQELDDRRKQREQQQMRDLYAQTHAQASPDTDLNDVEMRSASFASFANLGPQPQSTPQQAPPPPPPPQTPPNRPEDDSARLAAILESRRKLAELEQDRPLWEQAAAQRRAQEAAERRAAAERAEQERRMQEELERKRRAEQKAREEREEAERRAKEEERLRKEREEERLRKERERRQQQQRQSWRYGYWTEQRALERYLSLAQSFDERKFSKNGVDPITVEDIPWPVLASPSSFNIEDVTWDEVERFFVACRKKLRSQDFSKLVIESHRRFHPDRWRSRGVLSSVMDEVERSCMEVAANTVAQALTPIWQQVRR